MHNNNNNMLKMIFQIWIGTSLRVDKNEYADFANFLSSNNLI